MMSRVFALICLTILPPVAMAAGVGVAADVLAPTALSLDYGIFNNKGDIAIGVVAIISWTWIFRWMINQLDLQRAAHAKSQEQLIGYMNTDRVAVMLTVDKMADALKHTTETLDRIVRHETTPHPNSKSQS